ncbi:MAG: hypothetical protein GC159_05210 [Phycisphaera sp.]|nr:hypothetical protein [Phycisphaera sp.]
MRTSGGRYRKTRETWNHAGHAHELTFSCYHHYKLLTAGRTRHWLIGALDRARRKHPIELWAYVIMPEHAHVLLFPTQAEYDVSAIEKSIKQSVSCKALAWLRANDQRWLERLRGSRSGDRKRYHFWQPGGGYDRNVIEPATAWNMVAYIHANPVRRGLVERPTDWQWSSASWYEGCDDVVLKMDGPPPDAPLV